MKNMAASVYVGLIRHTCKRFGSEIWTEEQEEEEGWGVGVGRTRVSMREGGRGGGGGFCRVMIMIIGYLWRPIS